KIPRERGSSHASCPARRRPGCAGPVRPGRPGQRRPPRRPRRPPRWLPWRLPRRPLLRRPPRRLPPRPFLRRPQLLRRPPHLRRRPHFLRALPLHLGRLPLPCWDPVSHHLPFLGPLPPLLRLLRRGLWLLRALPVTAPDASRPALTR